MVRFAVRVCEPACRKMPKRARSGKAKLHASNADLHEEATAHDAAGDDSWVESAFASRYSSQAVPKDRQALASLPLFCQSSACRPHMAECQGQPLRHPRSFMPCSADDLCTLQIIPEPSCHADAFMLTCHAHDAENMYVFLTDIYQSQKSGYWDRQLCSWP